MLYSRVRGPGPAARCVVTDRGADQAAGDGCGVITAAGSELVPDNPTDDRANQRTARDTRGRVTGGVVLR